LRRRDFLRRATVGATATALAGCATRDEGSGPAVHTRPRLNWRLASSFPVSLDTIYGAADILAKRVSELTNERFRIRIYPQNELVPALQVLDAVQAGTVQLGHTASYYYRGKRAVLAFDTAVPFGLSARQQSAWLYDGGGSELMREIYADFNILPLPCGNTGVQMGGWFRREIPGLADLRGLKMRIPGLGGEVMSRLGVTVQTLAGGEIYQALERGAIDATEWVGPYDDEKLGFDQVASYYYYPGWWEPGPGLSLLVNLDAWASLPAEYRSILECASREAHLAMQTSYDALNPPALDRLLAKGVKLRRFSDEVMAAARRTAFEVMAEEAAADPGYAELFSQWKAFRAASYRWFDTAELAYGSFAYPQAEM
jgi:TRAP-type mannitol/chloroaromatic compound transport system substrate-binding protein